MRRSIPLIAVLYTLGVAALGVFAHPARAAGLSPPVADCDHNGKLTRTYSITELRKALASIPTDLLEYTPCYNVIQQALLAAVAKQKLQHGSGGSGGGSFLPAWLIVVLALLVVGGGGFTAYAWRRRGDA
jgi:hypothetical protein